jgi:hypothetical protein
MEKIKFKLWDVAGSYNEYSEADAERENLKAGWLKNNIEGMQVKIKRQNSTGKFLIKTRLHPDFEPKSGKKKKIRKRNKNKNDNI